jgi:hypothetical protein
VRGDLLVGETPRQVADLALLVGQLVQAHREGSLPEWPLATVE